METQQIIFIIFSLLLSNFILGTILIYLIKKIKTLTEKLNETTFAKKSTEVKYGKSWEQFVPFMDNFPYNKEKFKFLGEPIDGIVFEEDKIAFVEIKTGSSRLSEKQKNIKNLIENKKIEFKEIRY